MLCCMTRGLTVFALLLATLVAAIPAAAETLADILQREGAGGAPPSADLQLPISGYGVLNDSSGLVIGYYLADAKDPGALRLPLRVLLLDKSSGAWQHHEIQGKAYDDPGSLCAGAVLSIKRVNKSLFLETRLTTPATCTFVLSPSLDAGHILFGSPVAFFSSGRVIAQENTTHFAARHPLKLLLYDPATGLETPLLPRDDDAVAKRIRDELSALADAQWCNANNAPCDPEAMDGSTAELAVNNHTNAIALRVAYSGQGYGPKAAGYLAEVVYLFDLSGSTLRHRELRREELKKLYGSYTLEGLIQPAMLRQLFPAESR